MACRARFPVGILALALLGSLPAIHAPAAAAPVSEPTLSSRSAQRASAISAISIEAPAVVNAVEGTSISITATAGSGDPNSSLNIQVAGQPPGLTLTQFGSLPRFATLSGDLGGGTAGTWTLSWTVRDQFGAYDSTATLLIVDEPGGTGPSPLGEGRVLIAPTGASAGDQFGVSAAGVGDVNEDGFPDILIGAWTSDVFSGDEGRAYLYFGGPSMDATADLVLQGAAPGDNFGTTVSSAGDFNGDGHLDMIVGAWANDAAGLNAGSAHLYFGGPAMDALPDRVFFGEQAGDRFGRQVCSIGDFNADGFSDIAVGAHFNDAAGSNAGRAYIYFGGPAADAVADLVLTGEAAGDEFGWSISGGGDVNGDGFSDLVVGASGNDAVQPGAGRAYVYFGGPAADGVADWVLSGDVGGGRFGICVAMAGDPNGDGFDDVIVGADHLSPIPDTVGRAFLFHGGPSPDPAPDLTLIGDAPNGGFGFPVSSAGDMNGDGFGDVIVGSWLHPARGTQTGRAYVYFGGPGMDAVPDLTLTGERPGDLLGASVAAAGDVDGDGYDEIVVGAYFYDATLGEDGRAYVVGTVHGQGPVVTAPAAVAGQVGSLVSFGVSAIDFDGDEIALLTAAPLPAGATFSPNATNTFGTFAWTPAVGQIGSHVVVFTASNALSSSATTTIDVTAGGNAPPTLSGPAAVFGAEGVPIAFTVTATDPEGGRVTLGVGNRPVGSVFIDFGNNTGEFSWTPSYAQAGTYSISFTGVDPLGAAAVPLAVPIAVDNVNRSPIASAGGPYAGVVGVPVNFDGRESSDPDGDPLVYEWNFGDGTTGSGRAPSHVFASAGLFDVSLRVSDGTVSHTDATTASIANVFPASAFLDASNRTTRLQSAKAATCVQIEPVNGAYTNSSVIVSTIAMISVGTGSVDRIFAVSDKSVVGADRNRNGVSEITACFSKGDLRLLFANLPGGRSAVHVEIEGDLITGAKFHATLEMDVVVSGGAVAASLAPNPLRAGSMITVRSAQAGLLRIQIFDLRGRLVRTLLDRSFSEAGYHDIAIDGRRDDGSRLSSGVYFYRIQTQGGTASGRFTVLN